jgi:hypothetical protein
VAVQHEAVAAVQHEAVAAVQHEAAVQREAAEAVQCEAAEAAEAAAAVAAAEAAAGEVGDLAGYGRPWAGSLPANLPTSRLSRRRARSAHYRALKYRIACSRLAA